MTDKEVILPAVLPVGPECQSCIDRLERELLQTQGVGRARVDAAESHLHLWYDPEMASLEEIEKLANQAGIAVSDRFQHELFPLEDLTCPDCALTLESTVAKLPGVSWASINFAASRILVEYEQPPATRQVIAKEIRKLGYHIPEPGVTRGLLAREGKTIGTIGCALFALIGFIISHSAARSLAPWFFATAIVSGGIPVLRGALASVRSLSLDMNALMVLAVIGASAIGQWEEAAGVVLLFAIGGYLEARTSARARRALEALLKLSPERAEVKTDGGTDFRRVEDLLLEDIFVVRPGERIPTDGVVVAGYSALDQSPITGESVPVDKQVGDQVFAGSINTTGTLEVRVTKLAHENTLARIISLLQLAQQQKSRTSRRVDRFAHYYTPAVIALAVAMAVLPPLVWHAPWLTWFYRALTIMVVSCPCALVIGVPVTLVAGISAAARQGLLVKGGLALEQAARLRVLAFDKTGTLTQGHPEVTEVISLSGSPDEVIGLAAAAEANSEHHFARAIRHFALSRQLAFPVAQEFEALPGLGLKARIDGQQVYVGSRALFTKLGVGFEELERKLSQQTDGRTLILVGTQEKLLGAISLADRPRPVAKLVLEELRRLGLRLAMVTGDHKAAAKAIADAVGIDAWFSDLNPEQKIEVLRRLRSEVGPVGMVEEIGINDAPALAASDVGFAMGVAGSDAALEAADIALMADDLTKLPAAIRLSRRVAAIIAQNIGFALLVKACLVAIAFPGWLRLWLAVLGDTGASLIVVLNAMRLLRVERRNLQSQMPTDKPVVPADPPSVAQR